MFYYVLAERCVSLASDYQHSHQEEGGQEADISGGGGQQKTV